MSINAVPVVDVTNATLWPEPTNAATNYRNQSTAQFGTVTNYLETEVRTKVNAHFTDKVPHSNIPKCRVYHDANQSILDSQLTTLIFNSERFDNDTMHDNATNNSRITVNTAGKGVAYIALSFGSNATGIRSVNILLNGTTIIAQDTKQAVNGAATSFSFSAPPYDFALNDYIEITVYHTGGSPLDIVSSSAYSPEFGIVMEG